VLSDEGVIEVPNGALGDDGTAFEDVEAVADLNAEVEVLFDEQDSDSAFLVESLDRIADFGLVVVGLLGWAIEAVDAEGFERIADLIDDVGLDALGGFVEQEELGIGEEGAADGELLLLAAAEDASFAGKHLLEHGEEGKHAIEAAFEGTSLGDGADAKIFGDREIGKNVAALGHVAETGPGAGIGREAEEGFASESDGTAVGSDMSDDGLESGGLADAVTAHETDHLAGAHLEVDASEDA